MSLPAVHIIYENPDWISPIIEALEEIDLPYEKWDISKGYLELGQKFPDGIFLNKMSASAFLRDHHAAMDYAHNLLSLLEAENRRVINPSPVLKLEFSKFQQYTALKKEGFLIPKTLVIFGNKEIPTNKIKSLPLPLIVKPNCGGKGVGVNKFETYEEVIEYISDYDFSQTADNTIIVQEYIKPSDNTITRVEFIGEKMLYAVRVDTSIGFELCPAEACVVDDNKRSEFELCMVDSDNTKNIFTIIDKFDHPIAKQYEAFLKKYKIDIAGIEFVRDDSGALYTYDINTNTNYNPRAEAETGIYGVKKLAHFLASELEVLYPDTKYKKCG